MKSPSFQTGETGEDLACKLLKDKGYQILYRNWRISRQEIDIISQKGDYLVFVEVKTRKNNDFGFPEKAVTKTKQKSLIKAANAFIEQTHSNLKIRFDIIAITRLPNNWDIYHIEDAFYPFSS